MLEEIINELKDHYNYCNTTHEQFAEIPSDIIRKFIETLDKYNNQDYKSAWEELKLKNKLYKTDLIIEELEQKYNLGGDK